jgi:hypothetical protein
MAFCFVKIGLIVVLPKAGPASISQQPVSRSYGHSQTTHKVEEGFLLAWVKA